MNQVTQTMSSGCGFFPSLMVAFLWKSLFSGLLCPWLPAVQKHMPLPATPQKKTLHSSVGVHSDYRDATHSLASANHLTQRSWSSGSPLAANYGDGLRAVGPLIGQPESGAYSWIGEGTPHPPPESCSRGEAVCPQKKTGVLLLKAKRSKCKAATLLFVAYIVSWFG